MKVAVITGFIIALLYGFSKALEVLIWRGLDKFY